MLQLRNATPFPCSLAVLADHEAVDALIVAVTATFSFDGEPIARERGSAGADLSCGLPKPATDVLLSGHAYAPGGRADACEVQLRVGGVRKRVLATGNRVWRKHLFSVRPSRAEPFERLPLAWERAYGGTIVGRDGATACDERNPVGVGISPLGERPLPGSPLPNFELPHAPIRSWRDRPAPAGFSAIEAHWQPRRSYAGTYDESWSRTRAPYLPEDFDLRHLQEAPQDQIADGHLRGDETVELIHATPGGRELFRLPGVELAVSCRVAGVVHGIPVGLDTVALDADVRRIELLWRGSWRCDKRAADIASVDVIAARNGA